MWTVGELALTNFEFIKSTRLFIARRWKTSNFSSGRKISATFCEGASSQHTRLGVLEEDVCFLHISR